MLRNLNFAAYAAVGLQWFLGVPGWIHTWAYYFDFTYENEAWRISAGIRETEDEKQFVRETGTIML